ncbi:MAG: transporter substrate-binding domain-containing protein [Gammaproteobacteria bacterium]
MQSIREAGVLNCGVAGDMPGFSVVSSASAQGLEIDFCRGLAAALLGSADHARFARVAGIEEFLSRQDVDLVFHALTWSLEREARWNVRFGPVIYYDGAAFLTRKTASVDHVLKLHDASVCIDADNPSLPVIAQYLTAAKNLRLLALASVRESREAFLSGRCPALAGDASTLVAVATGHDPQQFDILQDYVTKEPLAPIVRARDDALLMLLRWVVYVTLEAEELGISSQTATAVITERLQALPPAGSQIAADSAARVIRSIGNYAEIFERNLDRPDFIRQRRGLNRLWRDGGLMYAPPFK